MAMLTLVIADAVGVIVMGKLWVVQAPTQEMLRVTIPRRPADGN